MGKVIFIVATGHSGSTILDLALGSINKVFSCGELVHFSWQLYRGPHKNDKQSYCSCGKDFKSCSTWSKVIQSIETENSIPIMRRPRKFNISIHSPFKFRKAYYSKFLQRLILETYPMLLGKALLTLFYLIFKKSIRNNWILFDQICAKTGSEFIIDSSKNPLRYLFLRLHRPDDIKLIILKRDVRGVASTNYHNNSKSSIKKRAKTWSRYYGRLIINILKEISEDSYRIIRYEDFCLDPVSKINTIADFIRLERIHEVDIDTNSRHLIAGNPIRHTGRIVIRHDDNWRSKLSFEEINLLSRKNDEIEEKLVSYRSTIV